MEVTKKSISLTMYIGFKTKINRNVCLSKRYKALQTYTKTSPQSVRAQINDFFYENPDKELKELSKAAD